MTTQPTALADAAQWVAAVATGSVATGVATIAVAAVGFAMLAGRIDVRRGAGVILGCFIVFGAPVIAASFVGLVADGEGEQVAVAAAPLPAAPAPPPAQPHDPYAGASLIR